MRSPPGAGGGPRPSAAPLLETGVSNAERRRTARQAAYASLPGDLHTLRRRAHALRAAGDDGYLAVKLSHVRWGARRVRDTVRWVRS